MEELLYYNELYDIYGKLLTDKQRKYFEDYYFNNYSYSEMADSYKVSRNAICKQLHIVVDKLNEYEKVLGLYKKKIKLLDIISKEKDDTLKDKLQRLL